MTDPAVVKGPSAIQDGEPSIIYQVTLTRGQIVTGPQGFGDGEADGPYWPGGPVVTETGVVITQQPSQTS